MTVRSLDEQSTATTPRLHEGRLAAPSHGRHSPQSRHAHRAAHAEARLDRQRMLVLGGLCLAGPFLTAVAVLVTVG